MQPNPQPQRGNVLQFRPAVKQDLWLRLALSGPSGSGKTYTLLKFATELAGPGGKIAVIDTEAGSASKYADLFQFDVIEPSVFSPDSLMQLIHGAAGAGYRALVADSLTHYWNGPGGILEMVDAAAAKMKSPNSFAAWKSVTPVYNELVQTILRANIHVLVGMRTKSEWVIEDGPNGKKTPKKIGTETVMRDGIEYEFDIAGELDLDHKLTFSKTRCPGLDGRVFVRPGKDVMDIAKAWLGTNPVRQEAPTPKPTPTPAPAAGPIPVAAEPVPPDPDIETPPHPDVIELWRLFALMEGQTPHSVGRYSELLLDLRQQFREQGADLKWVEILQEFKAEQPRDIYVRQYGGTKDKLKAFVRRCCEALIPAAAAAPAQPFAATDDDVPF